MIWLQKLAAELPITVGDGAVWVSIVQGLLFAGICLLLGVWVARFVGLLGSDAPAGETLSVGLASGLLIVASWWAAIASGGRSSFTPVAIGFAIAIAMGLLRRWRGAGSGPSIVIEPAGADPMDHRAIEPGQSARRANLVAAVLGGAVVVVAGALLYGSTMASSPRDAVQPVEFMDEAYYSILSADLAKTGTESIYSPSGFTDIAALPVQTWYHWGEAWLGAAVITAFGTEPLHARHLIVLPILLLAAAGLTGTVVRRFTRSASLGAFLFGFFACLLLAPVPFIAGPWFSAWAVGMLFGISLYGLGAVAALLAMYCLAVLSNRTPNWMLAVFVGSATALIVPAHLVIAVLGLIGIGSVWTVQILRSLVTTRRLPEISPVWRRTYVATGMAIAATLVWGLLTGHGVGTTGLSPSVTPFNESWRVSIAITYIGAGAFFAILIAWLQVRKQASIEAGLYQGTAVLLVVGAIVWGARLGDFTMFYVFFGGIAVFATPAAAVAVGSIWLRFRAKRQRVFAIALAVLCILQLEIGIGRAVDRLQFFGPHDYEPIATEVLESIRDLPPDAKLAYACRPSEEAAFWDARLLSIDAHTGRRIVPMCFEAEVFGVMTGTLMSADVPSPLFHGAPQRELYPDSSAKPSAERVTSFLKENGIDYIYADALHPNSLVPEAIPIATNGDVQILRIP